MDKKQFGILLDTLNKERLITSTNSFVSQSRCLFGSRAADILIVLHESWTPGRRNTKADGLALVRTRPGWHLACRAT